MKVRSRTKETLVALINAYPFKGRAYEISPPAIPAMIVIEPEGGIAVKVYVVFPHSQADLRFGMDLERLDYDGRTIWSAGQSRFVFEPAPAMDGLAKLGDGYVHPMGVT